MFSKLQDLRPDRQHPFLMKSASSAKWWNQQEGCQGVIRNVNDLLHNLHLNSGCGLKQWKYHSESLPREGSFSSWSKISVPFDAPWWLNGIFCYFAFCFLVFFKLHFQLGSAALADCLAAVQAGERVWKMRGGTGGDAGGPTSLSFNHRKPNAPSIRTQWGLKEERSCLALSDRDFLCLTRGPKGMWPLPSFLSSLL